MSKSLATSSLHILRRCERHAAQRCAYSTYRRLNNPQPLLPPLLLHPSHTHQRPPQHGSAQTTRHASGAGRIVRPSSGGRKSAPSMAVQIAKARKDALKSGQMPLDVGLLPDTLVMPSGKNLGGALRGTAGSRGTGGGGEGGIRRRLRLEWKRGKLRALETFQRLAYKFWTVKPRPRLDYFRVHSIAQGLHREVYEHFAEGNLLPIEAKVCEGFLGSLQKRIALRAPNTGVRWTVHRYLSKPRCVSFKAASFPFQKGELSTERNGVLQAVVRIRSLQSLQRIRKVSERDEDGRLVVREVVVDAQGNEVVGGQEEGAVPKDAKESVEYFVVQRNLRAGKDSPWMAWGTTEETKVAEMLKGTEKGVPQVA